MAADLTLTKAQNAVMAHDWSTAAKLYKELLKGDESNIEYLRELGSIYVKSGEDERAIPYYEQIIAAFPNDVDAMNSLGAIFRRLKRYEQSIQILQRAKNEDKDTASVNYNLGFTYKEMGNFEEAVSAFESVITENPDDVLAYNHLGSIYYAQKNYGKSIATYKRGLQVDPNHPILNYNLARCYEAEDSYPDAVRCYNAALKTRPGWLDAIEDFSALLIKCQQTKTAQDLVEQSIKLHPMDTNLLYTLGKIYLHQFDYDNATLTLKKADSIKSNDIQILSALAQALEKGANPEEALEKVLEAMDVDPDNKEIRKQYVHTLLSAEHYDKALGNLKELYDETGGSDLEVLDLYGQYYICQGDEEAANEYYGKIKKLDRHYKDYILEAADRYIQTGNYDNAEKYANEFVGQREKSPEGYAKLGKIYAARGKLQSARELYEKSISIAGGSISSNSAIKRLDAKLQENPHDDNAAAQVELPAQENAAQHIDVSAPQIPDDAQRQDNHAEIPDDSLPEALDEAPSLSDLAEDDGDFDPNLFGDDEPLPEENVPDESGQPDNQPDFVGDDFIPLTDELADEAEDDFWSEFADADDSDPASEDDAPAPESGLEPVFDDEPAPENLPEANDEPEKPEENPGAPITEDFIKQAVEDAIEARLNQMMPENPAEKSDDSADLIREAVEKAVEARLQQMLPESAEDEENFIDVDDFALISADDDSDSADDSAEMLGKIQRILKNTDLQTVSSDQIDLFKTLRGLLDCLPDGERNKSIAHRMCMLLAYLIDKLSGKPGLLATSESLIKSGVLGDQYMSQLSYEKGGEITGEMISKVLVDMKNLSDFLDDREVARGLCASADGILEQIELGNLSVL